MTADHGLDRLLDRLIVPGYSSLGHLARRRTWAAGDPPVGALMGRTALVTGAGSGLGEATALGLARLGARVHLLVRSAERAAPAVSRLQAALAAESRAVDLHVEECDVSDLTAVAAFAEDFRNREGGTQAVDVLVHNAGVMPPERAESVDGHELTVATHLLGPVLMTELLLPALRRAQAGARVVFVASGGMYAQALPMTDLEYERGDYRGAVAYARSKRMQVELTPLLARRWGDHVMVATMHPGWADTPGVAASLPTFRALARPLLRSPAAGADTAVWLAATQPAPATGGFWHDRRQRPTSYRTSTRPAVGEVERLWEWVADAIRIQTNSPEE